MIWKIWQSYLSGKGNDIPIDELQLTVNPCLSQWRNPNLSMKND